MSERLGYFITIIVAALGWLVTHYVDRVIGSPTIEYGITEETDGRFLVTRFRLTNVSRTQSFDNLDIHFLPRAGSAIRDFDIVPVEPASEGANRAAMGPEGAQFTVESLMPNGTVDFILKVGGSARPKMFVQSSRPARLTTRNFETWLVRHETSVIGGLILFWAIALLFVIATIANYEARRDAALARAEQRTRKGRGTK